MARLGHKRSLLFLVLVLGLYVITRGVNTGTESNLPLKCRLAPALCNQKPASYKPTSKNAAQASIESAKLAQIQKLYKAEDADRLALGHLFYKKILLVIVNAKPKLTKPFDQYKTGKFRAERFEYKEKSRTFPESYLLNYLQITDAEEREMTLSHQYALDNLPGSAPKGLYSGDGIVLVGGGKFNWLTLLSIKRIRAVGCTLPVEVLIPSFEDFEVDVCTTVFPSLNAKCIYMPMALFKDEVSRYGDHSQLTFKGYQYKCLALLLSSFENVLLLDSDNIVIDSPQEILKSEPFKSSGLVVWPDFWCRSTCPKFYSIAGAKVSKSKLAPGYSDKHHGYFQQTQEISPEQAMNEVSYHERLGTIPDPSTESGQLMISKKSHLKALLLAFYYNSFGPDYYYPLFSQGAPGEGDKETFLAGAIILDQPFYQVGTFVRAIGDFKNGEFLGHGMGQADPMADYERSLKFREITDRFNEPEVNEQLSKLPESHLMFLHANFPKLDPWELKNSKTVVDEKGRYRLYGSALKESTGRDVELEVWEIIDELLCGAKELKLEAFRKVSRADLCNEILEQKKFLVSTSSSLKG